MSSRCLPARARQLGRVGEFEPAASGVHGWSSSCCRWERCGRRGASGPDCCLRVDAVVLLFAQSRSAATPAGRRPQRAPPGRRDWSPEGARAPAGSLAVGPRHGRWSPPTGQAQGEAFLNGRCLNARDDGAGGDARHALERGAALIQAVFSARRFAREIPPGPMVGSCSALRAHAAPFGPDPPLAADEGVEQGPAHPVAGPHSCRGGGS